MKHFLPVYRAKRVARPLVKTVRMSREEMAALISAARETECRTTSEFVRRVSLKYAK
jgi:hypothetical protein